MYLIKNGNTQQQPQKIQLQNNKDVDLGQCTALAAIVLEVIVLPSYGTNSSNYSL
jgi:hypothetical protein